MKKIYAIGIVLIALCMLCAVCAVPQVKTPEGFTLNDNLTQTNQTGTFHGVSCEVAIYVMENGTDNITITDIVPSKSMDLTPEGSTVKKTISGKEGLFEEKDGRFLFMYSDSNTIVEINAPNEKLIEEVIGK